MTNNGKLEYTVTKVDENGWVVLVGKSMHLFYNEKFLNEFLNGGLQEALAEEQRQLELVEKRKIARQFRKQNV
jgi:hypothetical protein